MKITFIAFLVLIVFLVVGQHFVVGSRGGDASFLGQLLGLFDRTFFAGGTLVEEISLTREEMPKTRRQTSDVRERNVGRDDAAVSLCSFSVSGTPVRQGVIISEVAWMGTDTSFSHEWIELRSVSGNAISISGWQLLDRDEQIKVVFPDTAEVSADGFYLLERSEEAVPEVRADLVYAGNLRNSDEAVRLFGEDCNVVDEVAANPDWPAGDNKNKKTMERNVADLSWYTSSVSGGTPKQENSPPPVSIVKLESPKIDGNILETEPTEYQTPSGEVNINTANYEALQGITGIGPVIAGRIIDYRNQNGYFLAIEDIKNVSGIGDVTFEKMESEITVGDIVSSPPPLPLQETNVIERININTAGYDELQDIVGVGPVIAQRIIDYRNTNGFFQQIEDIKKVSGIGDVTFERMKGEIAI